MTKINFTSSHLDELKRLIADYVLNNKIIIGSLGQQYNVNDLINTLSIGSLRAISTILNKKKATLSSSDEWIENLNADKIIELEEQLQLVSLIIGYKLKQEEIAANSKERERLEKQLKDLEDSQKTPADLIAELRQKISELE